MLTNLRVSTNNMLLPFTAQILQLLQDAGAPRAAGRHRSLAERTCTHVCNQNRASSAGNS